MLKGNFIMGIQPFLIDEGTMLAVQILDAELPVSIQQRCMPPGHKNVIKRDIRIKMLALAAKHRYGFGQSYDVSTLIGVPPLHHQKGGFVHHAPSRSYYNCSLCLSVRYYAIVMVQLLSMRPKSLRFREEGFK
jgi:hypothetical protein